MDNLFAGMPSLLFPERGTAYPGYPASLGRRAGGRLPRNPGRLPSGRPYRTYGLPPARSGFLATTLPTREPRSGPALTGSAKAHVEGGALVVADGWQGYPCLSGMGYRPRPRSQRQLKRNEEIPPRVHRVFGNLKTWLRGTHHLRPVAWGGVNRIGKSGQSVRQPRCLPSTAPQCPFPIPAVVRLPNATAG
jgi:hypothetical protein